MTRIGLRSDVLDAQFMGVLRGVGLRKPYFYARETLRARLKKIPMQGMRDHNAIFVHVPKCAGSSIEQQRPIAAWHFSAAVLAKHDPAFWNRAFTFGFVRDPYDRLVSAFHYLRSETGHPRDVLWGQENLSRFADFQDFMSALERRSVRNSLLSWVHLLPQTYYLCDRENKVLVDFIGRTERFDADIDQVNTLSGLNLEHLHKNKAERPQDRPFYTPQSARIVEDIYAEDFEIFDYAKRDF